MDALGDTWEIVWAAGSLNTQLAPCDVDSFNSFYHEYPYFFRECVTVAFVKELKPVEAFSEALQGLGTKTGTVRREYVRLSWRKVVLQVVHDGQDLAVYRQLSRQGAGRFSCLARAMTIIGIIEPVDLLPCIDAGKEVFILGITGIRYRFCQEPDVFNAFYAGFEPADEAWAKSMKKHEGNGFNDFCRVTREVMDIAAQHSAAFALKAHGYCFDFAVRKFVIAESFHRYRGMTLATSQGSADPVEWEAVSIIEIRSVTADSGEHLCIFEPDAVAAAASAAVFGRTDWAVMLSCFACLWHEVKVKYVDAGKMELDVLLAKIRSTDTVDFVVDWKKKHGFSPHPHTLVCELMGDMDGESPPKKSKKSTPRSSSSNVAGSPALMIGSAFP